jgi:hypothetical protein
MSGPSLVVTPPTSRKWSAFRGESIPLNSVQGFITAVNTEEWTVTVKSELDGVDLFGVRVGALYLNPFTGEGVYAMPEVGSSCIAVVPSEGGRPFILTFCSPRDAAKGGFPGGRPEMAPGDMALLTKDGNGVMVRRGGVVEVRGSPVAKTMYSARRNRVFTIAENYDLLLFGGHLKWETFRPEENVDNKKASRFSMGAKEFAEDPTPIVSVVAGSEVKAGGTGVDEPVMQVRVRSSGEDEDATVNMSVEIEANKSGELGLKLTKARVHNGGDTEPVLRSSSFLADLAEVLAEFVVVAAANGVSTPKTAEMLAKITAGTYESQTLESE